LDRLLDISYIGPKYRTLAIGVVLKNKVIAC